jgi:hypothetical protein
MKCVSVCMMIAMTVLLTGCQVHGPSVKIKTPKVKLPGVEIGAQGGGKMCLPGQGKKC